eukprot:SAG31_NODE_7569_length_1651_cov_2.438144_1_plen_223_part_10
MPASKKVFTKVTFSNKTSKSMKKQMKKIAKQTVLGIAETKAVGLQTKGSPTVPALGLDHNIVSFHGNLLQTKQGVEDPNDYSSASARIGDEIILKNVNVRFMLSALRPNVTYRAILFWYESGTTLANDIVYFTQGNKLLDRYNTEQISIIDQKLITPNIGALPASDDNPRRTRLFTLNGNWKSKKVLYDNAATQPRFKDIGFALVAYDSINTLQTDAIAEFVY